MIAIPVSGTVFIIIVVLGAVLWAVELMTKTSRAAKRLNERRARESAPRANGSMDDNS